MVYCNLREVKDGIVTYAIGGRVNDITGNLNINMEDETWDLEQPENSHVAERHIASLLNRVFPDFRKGLFNKRLSYQIG